MDLIGRDQLRNLAETHFPICVSLYMPTYRFESESGQNPIRFKNLLREVRRELKETGVDDLTANQLLQRAEHMLEVEDFWHHMSDGMAVFLTQDAAHFYRLPVQFQEFTVCNSRFHLTPIFPLITANQKFYTLALSQKSVRLFQCTPFTIGEVEAPDIPKTMDEALKYDDPDANRTLLDSGRSQRWGRVVPEAMHGTHGSTPEDVTRQPHDDVHRFFQQIDEGLMAVIGEEKAPLVLACVEYYMPIYKDANSYGNLVADEYIKGSPEHVEPKQLHEQAWEIVKPILRQTQEDAMANLERLLNSNTELASDDLNEILPAAVFSRVDTLFVPTGTHRWGRYDPDKNVIELHADRSAGDEDLLNLAAVQTYLNGGTVHAVEEVNMPVKNAVAATFRYAAEMSASQA